MLRTYGMLSSISSARMVTRPGLKPLAQPRREALRSAVRRIYRRNVMPATRGPGMNHDPMGIKASLPTASGATSFVSLARLAAKTGADVARLPHTVKILLENIARRAVGRD